MVTRLVVGLLGLLVCVSPLHALELGLVTGRAIGTYYQIGQDLRTLVSREGITLTVYPSAGSLENVLAVYKRQGVQLGIVQSDVLDYIRAVSTDRELQRVAQQIKLVFPLYGEEVHLLATNASNITQFADLEGKTVAIGHPESGTFLTANLLLKYGRVTSAKPVEIDGKEALEALRKGQVDAMFYVAGVPVTWLQKEVSLDDKLHLVPITEKGITELYAPMPILAGTYSWHEGEVATVSVQATLITFDYQGPNCGHVGRFAKLLYDNLAWLRQNGHDKWRSVNLDAPLPPPWEQYRCVVQTLRGSAGIVRPSEASPQNPLTEALRRLLKTPE